MLQENQNQEVYINQIRIEFLFIIKDLIQIKKQKDNKKCFLKYKLTKTFFLRKKHIKKDINQLIFTEKDKEFRITETKNSAIEFIL